MISRDENRKPSTRLQFSKFDDGIAYTEILQFTYQDLHLLSKLLGTMNIFGLSFVLYENRRTR